MKKTIIFSAILLTSLISLAQTKDSTLLQAKKRVLLDTTEIMIDSPEKTASDSKIKKSTKKVGKSYEANTRRNDLYHPSSAVFRRKNSNL